MARRATLKTGETVTLWTREATEERLREAATTLKRLPATGCFPSQRAAGWPEVVREFWDQWGVAAHKPVSATRAEIERDRHKVRITPSPAQIERMDEALRWFWYVKQPRDRQIIFARCMGIRQKALGEVLECSREFLRQRYNAALSAITEALNRA